MKNKFSRQITIYERSETTGLINVLWQPKNKDGPRIFHNRDGPKWYQYIRELGPPKETGPPWKGYDKGKFKQGGIRIKIY